MGGRACAMSVKRKRDDVGGEGVLKNMMGTQCSVEKFFQEVWEVQPRVFRRNKADGVYPPLYQFGELLGVLQNAESSQSEQCHALVMRHGCPTDEYASCASAYLDGCSIVVNHAEQVSEEVKKLCPGLRN